MALAYLDDGHLFVLSAKGELGPKSTYFEKARNKFWAITALVVLCEEELVQEPVTCWKFKEEMQPAIERIFLSKKKEIEYGTKQEVMARVSAFLCGEAPYLSKPRNIYDRR